MPSDGEFSGAGLGRASDVLMPLWPILSQSFPIIVNAWLTESRWPVCQWLLEYAVVSALFANPARKSARHWR